MSASMFPVLYANLASFEHLRSLDQRSIRCVNYEPYVRGEKPWATFQFFYRSHGIFRACNKLWLQIEC